LPHPFPPPFLAQFYPSPEGFGCTDLAFVIGLLISFFFPPTVDIFHVTEPVFSVVVFSLGKAPSFPFVRRVCMSLFSFAMFATSLFLSFHAQFTSAVVFLSWENCQPKSFVIPFFHRVVDFGSVLYPVLPSPKAQIFLPFFRTFFLFCQIKPLFS